MADSQAGSGESEGRKSFLRGLIGLLFLAGVVVSLVFFVFGQVVGPNEIGIRRNYVSLGVLKEGYQENGLLPGLHWKIPGVSTVQMVARDFYFLHLNNDSNGPFEEDSEYSRRLGELEIPTTDGSKIKTDVTLVVRYFDGPGTEPAVVPTDDTSLPSPVPFAHRKELTHGGPRELINIYTTDPTRQMDLLVRQAEDYLKKNLSNLSTTDFYNPSLREAAALNANDAINSSVNQHGIEIWASLIRRYVYSEQNIDNQIFAKNLQEQTERLNSAKRRLEEARAETKDKMAELDAKIMDVKVQGEQEKAVIVSEADRYELEQRSVGDRMVQEAYAEVDRLKNTVLTETKGADVYIARQMAPILSTLQGGVVTDIDPFNINDWVKKFIAPEVK